MVTMRDIAREAGVSQATVSYILNRREVGVKISERRRREVMAVAERLGYCRNEMARAMVTGESHEIAFVGGNLGAEYVGRILATCARELGANGYSLRIYGDFGADTATEARAAIERRPAGVIAYGVVPEALARAAEAYDIPVALVDSEDPDPRVLSVNSDDYRGGYLATEHLLSLGHRELIHVTTPCESVFTRLRRQGFFDACRDYGVSDAEARLFLWDCREGEAAFVALLARDAVSPTAAFCSTDSLGALALRAARAAGRIVPDAFSVVAFADTKLTEWCDPPLTTIAQPFEEMGRRVARLLLDKIKGKDAVETIKEVLPVRLVKRRSAVEYHK